MRAILFAKGPVVTCWRLRALRLASHVLRPEDCFVLCRSTVCAPKTKSFRRYLFPRLLVPVSCCLPPLECSPGTTPNQAADADLTNCSNRYGKAALLVEEIIREP